MDDRRFFRSSDRILGGVCAGLAGGLRLDPLWIRLLFVLLVFLQGLGVFLYVVLWLVMPERLEGGATRAGFDSMAADINRAVGELQAQFGGRRQAPTPGPPTSTPTPGTPANPSWQQRPSMLGLILVVVGLVVLAGNVGVIKWSVVWPAALITVGIVLLVRNLERPV